MHDETGTPLTDAEFNEWFLGKLVALAHITGESLFGLDAEARDAAALRLVEESDVVFCCWREKGDDYALLPVKGGERVPALRKGRAWSIACLPCTDEEDAEDLLVLVAEVERVESGA